MHLNKGIQQFMGEAYEAGCYALCLVDVAQEYMGLHKEQYRDWELDVLRALYTGCEKGYIYYNWKNLSDNDNFFVQYPALFLEILTGRKWEVRKEGAMYLPKENEFVVHRYERQKTGYTIAHFQRDDVFEPIEGSLTVAQGKVVSTRVCRVLN